MAYRRPWSLSLIASLFLFSLASASAQMAVRHPMGSLRGFLTIRAQSGAAIGYAELSQTISGDEITAHMVYRFHDGSIDDETTIFTQRKTFQLISDHHIQKGPFFPTPSDILVEGNGKVTTRSMGKDGQVKTENSQVEAPEDLANGLVGMVLENIPPDTAPFQLGMLVSSGKVLAIKLDISRDSQQSFRIAGTTQHGTVYRVKPKIGGLAGVIAPIIGKQPQDVLITVLEGDVPSVVRIVGPLALGTAIVSVELAGTTFHGVPASTKQTR